MSNMPNDREQRRASLVQAAMRAIRQHGPDVAMEDIAAAAGVSKPILYRHFLDKGDLYMAVSETATEQLRTALLSSLTADTEPRTALQLVIEEYLTFIEQQPQLYRFVVRRSFTDRPLSRDPVTTNAALISETLATILRDRLRGLSLDSGGAETWAHAGVGMVQAAADWWLEHRTLSRDALRDYLVTLAWGGLSSILPAHPTANPTRRLSAGPIST
ncbi:MAG: TetR/AcrR family transcriptional regulator [Pseudonocardiaceae bacterium]